VVLVVDEPNLNPARVRRTDRVGDEVADLAGQADVVERQLERAARLLDEVDDAPCDVVGGLTAVPQLVELEAQKSWFSPAKISLTESSVKIFRIDSVSRSAVEMTRIMSGALSLIGIVSVTTMPDSGELVRFSNALPEKTPWVATA
jgi:hypothetical protein